MGKYQEIADQARGGVFDAARRIIRLQEEVLGAFENYQNRVATEVREPWSLAEANYDLAKQVVEIQTNAALEWMGAFTRTAQETVHKTAGKPAA